MSKPARFNPQLVALAAALALYGASGWSNPALAEAENAPVAATADVAPAATAETAAAAAAPAETAAAPATATDAAADTSTAESATPAHARNRTLQNQRIAQIREAARQRRENMERWRSARRWWNNPAAEDRRQWNRARSEWQRELIEARRRAEEQARPDYSYRYHYWRAYP